MSKDLILNSLEIQQFRCFRELRIGHLGRVNLIVGKNNVGKSTLLEALQLFARPGSLADLLEILLARDEISLADVEERNRGPFHPLGLDSLFFDRKEVSGEEASISIGPLDSPEDKLSIVIQIENAIVYPKIETKEQIEQINEYLRFNSKNISKFHSLIRRLLFRVGAATRLYSLGVADSETLVRIPDAGSSLAAIDPATLTLPMRTIPLHAVGPNGLGGHAIAQLWDKAYMSPLEKDVISALRIISPEVERVGMKGSGDPIKGNSPDRAPGNRIPFVKVEGFEEPIPLLALGDGVNRLFGLALALVHAKDGFLLVDEIENGIHYSVQADLWRLIFKMAGRLNVQVFATTHSYDCIKAFEEAARESEEEGVLVRLARKGDRTLVGEFDERELEIAVEGEIEVR